jgi:hypothetical protein
MGPAFRREPFVSPRVSIIWQSVGRDEEVQFEALHRVAGEMIPHSQPDHRDRRGKSIRTPAQKESPGMDGEKKDRRAVVTKVDTWHSTPP